MQPVAIIDLLNMHEFQIFSSAHYLARQLEFRLQTFSLIYVFSFIQAREYFGSGSIVERTFYFHL